MTELQEARALWLDAETRFNAEQSRRMALESRVYELESKLMQAKFQAITSEMAGFTRGLFAPYSGVGKSEEQS